MLHNEGDPCSKGEQCDAYNMNLRWPWCKFLSCDSVYICRLVLSSSYQVVTAVILTSLYSVLVGQ